MSYTDANSSRVVLEGQRPASSVPHTSAVVLVALLVLAFFVGGAGTYAVLRYRAPIASAASAVSSAHVTSVVVDVGTPVETLAAPPVVPTTTRITFPRSPISHRVWIDGALAGDDRNPMTITCGRHTIKVGSQGRARVVDLPCGGETKLD